MIPGLLLLVPALLLWIPTASSGKKRSFVVAIKAMVSAVILVFGLAAVFFYFPWNIAGSPDANPRFEQASPNGKYVAEVFENGAARNSFLGSTVEISTFVSLRPKGQEWKPGEDQVVFQIDNEPEMNLAWSGNDVLEIEHGPSVVEMKAAKWNGITISDISPGQIPGPVAIGQDRRKSDAIMAVACALILSTALFWLKGGRGNLGAMAIFACRVGASLAWIALCAYSIYQNCAHPD